MSHDTESSCNIEIEIIPQDLMEDVVYLDMEEDNTLPPSAANDHDESLVEQNTEESGVDIYNVIKEEVVSNTGIVNNEEDLEVSSEIVDEPEVKQKIDSIPNNTCVSTKTDNKDESVIEDNQKTESKTQIACEICNHVFISPASSKDLINHYKKYVTKTQLMCSVCLLKRNQQKHVSTHSEKPLKCNLCSYNCEQKITLDFHILSTHKDNKRPFKCKLCDYEGEYKNNLSQHMLTHSDEKPVERNVVYDECKFRGSLKKYRKSRSNVKVKRKSKRYDKYKNNIKQHLSICEDIPLECDACGYMCLEKRHMKQHMLIHTA